jgi:hypothetical protein
MGGRRVSKLKAPCAHSRWQVSLNYNSAKCIDCGLDVTLVNKSDTIKDIVKNE